MELFRNDILPKEIHPEMGYISMTSPGVARGPHEHVSQTDVFCFVGPGNFLVKLWEKGSKYSTDLTLGKDNPSLLVVPPGVVHAYKNISKEDGIVFNFPNKLYAGPGKLWDVDEIRHEDDFWTTYVIA